ncbi:triose-phosphate isomerase [Thermoanaerobacterium thermosaccharolyticum]|uniref:triose-phosphate isomerase family protein n=1 Tax=Thermoanaerobacterium thermosaccharolyticum TaxID=1517 RepID=UPI003D2D6E41
MRKKIVGASWKMHINSIKNGLELAKEIKDYVGNIDDIEMFILPAFPMIKLIADILKGTSIKWGAQNMCFSEKGAYTGEVPPQILKELECNYVEIGHAERRMLFNERDETVNKKVKLSLKYGLIPIVCIGETQEDLDNNFQNVKLRTQVLWALNGIEKQEMREIIFAYEPVWAIGKQKTADPEYVQSMHSFIRNVIIENYGYEAGNSIRIIYGGSVSPESASLLTKYGDVDGLFVGRFGLNAQNFKSIVQSVIKNNIK